MKTAGVKGLNYRISLQVHGWERTGGGGRCSTKSPILLCPVILRSTTIFLSKHCLSQALCLFCWLVCLLSTSAYSALGVLHIMRYMNLLNYLSQSSSSSVVSVSLWSPSCGLAKTRRVSAADSSSGPSFSQTPFKRLQLQ